MADKKEPEKTLEMRVAELEDKLKGLQVTEEEMKAYNKVAAMMGGGGAIGCLATAGPVGLTPVPDSCVIAQCIPRLHRRPAMHPPLRRQQLHPRLHDPRLHDPSMLHPGLHQ